MNAAVVYVSRTGNTKKVAEAIAQAVGCAAQSVSEYGAGKPVDLLFVGGSLYGGVLDPALDAFIRGLDPKAVGRAAAFSTHVSGEKADGLIKAALAARGIPAEAGFACKGRCLFLNLGHPSRAELDEAGRFAAYVAGMGV
jgi:flavodoxin